MNPNTSFPPVKVDTPLHWTAEYGRVAAVQKLLAAGADVTAVNINGNTPLHFFIGPHIRVM